MTTWNEIRLPEEEERLWELFHENSKLSPYYPGTNGGHDSTVNMEKMHVSLPVLSTFSKSLEDADDHMHELSRRVFFSPSANPERRGTVSFTELSRILIAGSAVWQRDFDSGISLSPLELYVFISGIDGLPQGVYHFDPQKHVVQFMDADVSAEQLSEAFPVDGGFPIYLVITALFQRTASSYGERGYRVALAESGRLMQNIILSCAMQSLPARPIINFYDRRLERILRLDGVNHSVLQVIAI